MKFRYINDVYVNKTLYLLPTGYLLLWVATHNTLFISFDVRFTLYYVHISLYWRKEVCSMVIGEIEVSTVQVARDGSSCRRLVMAGWNLLIYIKWCIEVHYFWHLPLFHIHAYKIINSSTLTYKACYYNFGACTIILL